MGTIAFALRARGYAARRLGVERPPEQAATGLSFDIHPHIDRYNRDNSPLHTEGSDLAPADRHCG